MALVDQRRTFRFPLPHEIVHDRTTTIEAPVYLDGAELTATAGTITITDETGTAVVDAVAVTALGPPASYDVADSLFEATDVSELVHVRWTLTIGGVVDVGENDGLIVARELHPVISDVDIIRGRAALDPANGAVIHNYTDFQDFIDESWTELLNRLIEDGRRANYIMSPSSLRSTHLYLTLQKIYEDLASHLNTAYAETAKGWEKRYNRAYDSMTVLEDGDDDGQVDHRGRRGVAQSSIWLV
jgi:hypothetical protein